MERRNEDAKDRKQILAYFYMKVQVLGYTKLTIQNFLSKERKKEIGVYVLYFQHIKARKLITMCRG